MLPAAKYLQIRCQKASRARRRQRRPMMRTCRPAACTLPTRAAADRPASAAAAQEGAGPDLQEVVAALRGALAQLPAAWPVEEASPVQAERACTQLLRALTGCAPAPPRGARGSCSRCQVLGAAARALPAPHLAPRQVRAPAC